MIHSQITTPPGKKKTAFWNQCAIFPSTFTTLPTDSSTRIPQSTVPGWRAIGTESYNQVVQPTIKSKKKQQWLKNHKLTSSIKFVVYMCFTIFTQAPLRPGWYHVCPFHICTRTLRVKEKRTISLRTSQGVEPNVERPQHPQASEFLWSTPLWNRTNKTWNQQFHHDRKTHPMENPKPIQTPWSFSQLHIGHHGAATVAIWGTSPVKDVYFSSGFILCKADTIQPKWLKAVLAIDIFMGKCQCVCTCMCIMYIYIHICIYIYTYVYIYMHIHIYVYTYNWNQINYMYTIV